MGLSEVWARSSVWNLENPATKSASLRPVTLTVWAPELSTFNLQLPGVGFLMLTILTFFRSSSSVRPFLRVFLFPGDGGEGGYILYNI